MRGMRGAEILREILREIKRETNYREIRMRDYSAYIHSVMVKRCVKEGKRGMKGEGGGRRRDQQPAGSQRDQAEKTVQDGKEKPAEAETEKGTVSDT